MTFDESSVAYAGIAGGGSTSSSSAGGISIGGSLKPVNDPVYDYVFDVTLLAGSTIAYGDTFTIDNLIGVTYEDPTYGTSGASYVGNYNYFVPSIDQLNSLPESDVTWTYLSIHSLTATSDTLLGEFTITTTVQYPLTSPPYTVGETINYGSDLGGVVSSGVLVVSSVPEPSSVMLLVLGIAIGFPAFLVRQRRTNRKHAVARIVA
jgi:hypothetical protein